MVVNIISSLVLRTDISATSILLRMGSGSPLLEFSTGKDLHSVAKFSSGWDSLLFSQMSFSYVSFA